MAQVTAYFTPELLPHAFINDLEQGFKQFRSPDEEDWIHLTEVLDPDDDRAIGKEMDDAKKNEIKNLLEKGTFKVILKEEIPHDGNVLPGRFILVIKSSIDGKTKYKDRYVIGGH